MADETAFGAWDFFLLGCFLLFCVCIILFLFVGLRIVIILGDIFEDRLNPRKVRATVSSLQLSKLSDQEVWAIKEKVEYEGIVRGWKDREYDGGPDRRQE